MLLHSRLPHKTQASCRFHRAALISAPDDQKKPKGNMSRGSDSRCFRVPLVARKNISLVSLWALQVSIGGALLVAREHKTANVRKKVGRRSKALRMCPFMNVLSPRTVSEETQAPPVFAGTNLGSFFPRYFV